MDTNLFSKESFEQAAASAPAPSASLTAPSASPSTSAASSSTTSDAPVDPIPGAKRDIASISDGTSDDSPPPAKKQRVEENKESKEYVKRVKTSTHNSSSDIAVEDGGPEPEADDDDGGVVVEFTDIDPKKITFDTAKVSGAEGGVVFLRALYDGKPFVVQEEAWTPKFDVRAAPTSKTIRDNMKVGPGGQFKWPTSVYGDAGAIKKAIHDRILELKPTFPKQFKMSGFDKTTKSNKEYGFEGFVRMTSYKNKTYNEYLKEGKGDQIPADAEVWESTIISVGCHRDEELKVSKILEKTVKSDDGMETTQNNFTNSKGEAIDASEFLPQRKFKVLWSLSVSSQPARNMWGAKCRAVAIRKMDPPKQFKPKFK
jgi:hypothetical protein